MVPAITGETMANDNRQSDTCESLEGNPANYVATKESRAFLDPGGETRGNELESTPKSMANTKQLDDRQKTTIYLDREDRKRADQLSRKYKYRTRARAIRKALKLATESPPELPDTATIGFEILRWVEKLPFLSQKDVRRLREFGMELYKLKTRAPEEKET